MTVQRRTLSAAESRREEEAADSRGAGVPATPAKEYQHPHVARWQWLLGTNFAERPLLQRLNWLHVPLLSGLPLLALYGMFTTSLTLPTLVFSVIYYFLTGMGITAGYHRLWSHRAYEASLPVRLMLLFLGSGAVEGSVRWWCRDHRAHHRYSDTEKDPYAVQNGFWYAHIGWMLVKQDSRKIGRASIKDLNEDSWLRWQHRNYLPIALVSGFLTPCLIAGLLWGDYRGGFFIAGVARLVFVHHSTFCVNSLAHYVGDATYDDDQTARNSFITAIVTLGEGYHNFHHLFVTDYRNGVRWYQYDPTKLFIKALHCMGLVSNLRVWPDNEIAKAELGMRERLLQREKQSLNWGPDPDTLPFMTLEDVREGAQVEGRSLLVVGDFVLDVDSFEGDHPGGAQLLRSYMGKDATAAFEGGVYAHSNAAKLRTQTLRVGRVVRRDD